MRVFARRAKAAATVQVEALHVSTAKLDDGLQKGILVAHCAKLEDGALSKVRRPKLMHVQKNALEEPTALRMERHLSFPVLIVPWVCSQTQRENHLVPCVQLEPFNPVLLVQLALSVQMGGIQQI